MNHLTAALPRSLSVLICWACLALSAPAVAQSSDADARRHFEAGVSYFNTSDYDGALREFERAYQLSDPDKRPIILRNIASVHERTGNLDATVATLEKYLAEAPNAEDRATIELRIENLKKKIAEREAAKAAALPPPATAPVVTAPPPPPPAEPDHTAAYISWGVGGAAAVGAVITGIIAQGKYSDAEDGCAKTPAGCADDDVGSIDTMAWVSTVLTGVAVVGAGVGTVLYFTAEPPKMEQSTGLMPRLSAGGGPKGAGVEARWTF